MPVTVIIMPDPTFDGAVRAVETVLYSVSSVLYLPVLVAIAALLLYMLACLGAFLGEWRERRRGARLLVDGARAAIDTCVRESAMPLDAHLERIVQSAEGAGLRRLDAVRFVVRVGPALGLMGTLIPMGIALAGLADRVHRDGRGPRLQRARLRAGARARALAARRHAGRGVRGRAGVGRRAPCARHPRVRRPGAT